jgi:hypothetical protein
VKSILTQKAKLQGQQLILLAENNMEVISTFSNGNYEAQVAKSFDNLYTVTYMIDGKVIRKTNHVKLDLAESVAGDFILDGGNDQQFLSD